MGQARMSNWATQDAERHLRQSCRVMARLIVEHGPCPLADREFRPFQTLANSIISQQLSAKAADTIERRVQAIVPGFTPAEFLAVQPEALRAAGLSSAKARYILELAQRVSDGRLNLEAMQEAPDADVIAALVGVVCGRGRNPTLRLWPAIFSGEIDVFPSERRNMGQEIGR